MTVLCGLSNCDALRLPSPGQGGRSCMFLSRPKSLSDAYVQNRLVMAALRWRVVAFKAADGAVDTQGMILARVEAINHFMSRP